MSPIASLRQRSFDSSLNRARRASRHHNILAHNVAKWARLKTYVGEINVSALDVVVLLEEKELNLDPG